MLSEEDFYRRYEEIVRSADKLAQSLERMHRQHMQCRLGCAFCCMDYHIFPVEYFAILRKLKEIQVRFNPSDAPDECVFLVNNSCMIYGFRPLICRTHGLPLLYTNEEGEWELSACELNFTGFGEEFHTKNTFPQDRFNSELFMLNREFIAVADDLKLSELDLLPLKSMKDKLQSV